MLYSTNTEFYEADLCARVLDRKPLVLQLWVKSCRRGAEHLVGWWKTQRPKSQVKTK